MMGFDHSFEVEDETSRRRHHHFREIRRLVVDFDPSSDDVDKSEETPSVLVLRRFGFFSSGEHKKSRNGEKRKGREKRKRKKKPKRRDADTWL